MLLLVATAMLSYEFTVEYSKYTGLITNLLSGVFAVSAMSVMVAGSGNVDFRGTAETLKARVAGSGDVRARQVTGAVSKTIMGSGGVTIGD